MVNSRQKGKRAERELARVLREMGFESARRGQQFQGSPDSPDIADAIEGIHIECKMVERLNIEEAMGQAEADAGDDTPIVIHRRKRTPWRVTLSLKDLFILTEKVLRSCPSLPGGPTARPASSSSESPSTKAASSTRSP